jgi:hypothetical protein
MHEKHPIMQKISAFWAEPNLVAFLCNTTAYHFLLKTARLSIHTFDERHALIPCLGRNPMELNNTLTIPDLGIMIERAQNLPIKYR